MMGPYFKAALGQISHNKFASGINVVSLSIALAAALFVMLFVRHELSYDHWIPKAEHIYRYETEIRDRGGSSVLLAVAPTAAAQVLVDHYPEIEAITRFNINEHSLHMADRVHFEYMAFADENLFEVLDIPLLEGDKATALRGVSSLLLSESKALKYFGNQSPIGQTLSVESVEGGELRDFRVTGVFRDIPMNSHLDLNFILSNQSADDGFGFFAGGWNNLFVYTYLKLAEGTDIEAMEAGFPAILDTFVDTSNREEGTRGSDHYSVSLNPLLDIHMSERNFQPMRPLGDWGLLYALTGIATLILAIALINFTNLSLARSFSRAREVSIRKVHGAKRHQLMNQYFIETAILSLLALALAILILAAALPALNSFTGKILSLAALVTADMLLAVLALLILVAALAGLYPALVISSFRPAAIFRGALGKGNKGHRLRMALVVFQFTVSIVLGISAVVIQSQRHFTATHDLGFTVSDKLIVRWMNWGHFAEKSSVINERIRSLPQVIGTAYSNVVPGDAQFGTLPMTAPGQLDKNPVRGRPINVDEGFFDVYEVELLAGRFFDLDFGEDDMLDADEEGEPRIFSTILSESSAQQLGFESPEAALGIILDVQHEIVRPKIVGVVRDFHFSSLRDEIVPSIYYMDSAGLGNLTVHFQDGTHIPSLVEDITEIWKDFLPRDPITLEYLDQNVAALYENDRQQGMMVTSLAGLALMIACLGLYGLSALTAAEKSREVSIRKVHGASILNIVTRLLWRFSIPVFVAILFAWPLGWLGTRQYLEQFSYRIDLSPLIFLGAGLAALLIAGLTVGGHAFKVAISNPIHALRERE